MPLQAKYNCARYKVNISVVVPPNPSNHAGLRRGNQHGSRKTCLRTTSKFLCSLSILITVFIVFLEFGFEHSTRKTEIKAKPSWQQNAHTCSFLGIGHAYAATARPTISTSERTASTTACPSSSSSPPSERATTPASATNSDSGATFFLTSSTKVDTQDSYKVADSSDPTNLVGGGVVDSDSFFAFSSSNLAESLPLNEEERTHADDKVDVPTVPILEPVHADVSGQSGASVEVGNSQEGNEAGDWEEVVIVGPPPGQDGRPPIWGGGGGGGGGFFPPPLEPLPDINGSNDVSGGEGEESDEEGEIVLPPLDWGGGGGGWGGGGEGFHNFTRPPGIVDSNISGGPSGGGMGGEENDDGGAFPKECFRNFYSELQTLYIDGRNTSDKGEGEVTKPKRRFVRLAECRYEAGLVLAAPSGAHFHPIYHLTFVIDGVYATNMRIDESLNFSTGSSLTIVGCSMSQQLTSIASVSNGGTILISYLSPVTATTPPTLSSAVSLVVGGTISGKGSTITIANTRLVTVNAHALMLSPSLRVRGAGASLVVTDCVFGWRYDSAQSYGENKYSGIYTNDQERFAYVRADETKEGDEASAAFSVWSGYQSFLEESIQSGAYDRKAPDAFPDDDNDDEKDEASSSSMMVLGGSDPSDEVGAEDAKKEYAAFRSDPEASILSGALNKKYQDDEEKLSFELTSKFGLAQRPFSSSSTSSSSVAHKNCSTQEQKELLFRASVRQWRNRIRAASARIIFNNVTAFGYGALMLKGIVIGVGGLVEVERSTFSASNHAGSDVSDIAITGGGALWYSRSNRIVATVQTLGIPSASAAPGTFRLAFSSAAGVQGGPIGSMVSLHNSHVNLLFFASQGPTSNFTRFSIWNTTVSQTLSFSPLSSRYLSLFIINSTLLGSVRVGTAGSRDVCDSLSLIVAGSVFHKDVSFGEGGGAFSGAYLAFTSTSTLDSATSVGFLHQNIDTVKRGNYSNTLRSNVKISYFYLPVVFANSSTLLFHDTAFVAASPQAPLIDIDATFNSGSNFTLSNCLLNVTSVGAMPLPSSVIRVASQFRGENTSFRIDRSHLSAITKHRHGINSPWRVISPIILFQNSILDGAVAYIMNSVFYFLATYDASSAAVETGAVFFRSVAAGGVPPPSVGAGSAILLDGNDFRMQSVFEGMSAPMSPSFTTDDDPSTVSTPAGPVYSYSSPKTFIVRIASRDGGLIYYGRENRCDRHALYYSDFNSTTTATGLRRGVKGGILGFYSHRNVTATEANNNKKSLCPRIIVGERFDVPARTSCSTRGDIIHVRRHELLSAVDIQYVFNALLSRRDSQLSACNTSCSSANVAPPSAAQTVRGPSITIEESSASRVVVNLRTRVNNIDANASLVSNSSSSSSILNSSTCSSGNGIGSGSTDTLLPPTVVVVEGTSVIVRDVVTIGRRELDDNTSSTLNTTYSYSYGFGYEGWAANTSEPLQLCGALAEEWGNLAVVVATGPLLSSPASDIEDKTQQGRHGNGQLTIALGVACVGCRAQVVDSVFAGTVQITNVGGLWSKKDERILFLRNTPPLSSSLLSGGFSFFSPVSSSFPSQSYENMVNLDNVVIGGSLEILQFRSNGSSIAGTSAGTVRATEAVATGEGDLHEAGFSATLVSLSRVTVPFGFLRLATEGPVRNESSIVVSNSTFALVASLSLGKGHQHTLDSNYINNNYSHCSNRSRRSCFGSVSNSSVEILRSQFGTALVSRTYRCATFTSKDVYVTQKTAPEGASTAAATLCPPRKVEGTGYSGTSLANTTNQNIVALLLEAAGRERAGFGGATLGIAARNNFTESLLRVEGCSVYSNASSTSVWVATPIGSGAEHRWIGNVFAMAAEGKGSSSGVDGGLPAVAALHYDSVELAGSGGPLPATSFPNSFSSGSTLTNLNQTTTMGSGSYHKEIWRWRGENAKAVVEEGGLLHIKGNRLVASAKNFFVLGVASVGGPIVFESDNRVPSLGKILIHTERWPSVSVDSSGGGTASPSFTNTPLFWIKQSTSYYLAQSNVLPNLLKDEGSGIGSSSSGGGGQLPQTMRLKDNQIDLFTMPRVRSHILHFEGFPRLSSVTISQRRAFLPPTEGAEASSTSSHTTGVMVEACIVFRNLSVTESMSIDLGGLSEYLSLMVSNVTLPVSFPSLPIFSLTAQQCSRCTISIHRSYFSGGLRLDGYFELSSTVDVNGNVLGGPLILTASFTGFIPSSQCHLAIIGNAIDSHVIIGNDDISSPQPSSSASSFSSTFTGTQVLFAYNQIKVPIDKEPLKVRRWLIDPTTAVTFSGNLFQHIYNPSSNNLYCVDWTDSQVAGNVLFENNTFSGPTGASGPTLKAIGVIIGSVGGPSQFAVVSGGTVLFVNNTFTRLAQSGYSLYVTVDGGRVLLDESNAFNPELAELVRSRAVAKSEIVCVGQVSFIFSNVETPSSSSSSGSIAAPTNNGASLVILMRGKEHFLRSLTISQVAATNSSSVTSSKLFDSLIVVEDTTIEETIHLSANNVVNSVILLRNLTLRAGLTSTLKFTFNASFALYGSDVQRGVNDLIDSMCVIPSAPCYIEYVGNNVSSANGITAMRLLGKYGGSATRLSLVNNTISTFGTPTVGDSYGLYVNGTFSGNVTVSIVKNVIRHPITSQDAMYWAPIANGSSALLRVADARGTLDVWGNSFSGVLRIGIDSPRFINIVNNTASKIVTFSSVSSPNEAGYTPSIVRVAVSCNMAPLTEWNGGPTILACPSQRAFGTSTADAAAHISATRVIPRCLFRNFSNAFDETGDHTSMLSSSSYPSYEFSVENPVLENKERAMRYCPYDFHSLNSSSSSSSTDSSSSALFSWWSSFALRPLNTDVNQSVFQPFAPCYSSFFSIVFSTSASYYSEYNDDAGTTTNSEDQPMVFFPPEVCNRNDSSWDVAQKLLFLKKSFSTASADVSVGAFARWLLAISLSQWQQKEMATNITTNNTTTSPSIGSLALSSRPWLTSLRRTQRIIDAMIATSSSSSFNQAAVPQFYLRKKYLASSSSSSLGVSPLFNLSAEAESVGQQRIADQYFMCFEPLPPRGPPTSTCSATISASSSSSFLTSVSHETEGRSLSVSKEMTVSQSYLSPSSDHLLVSATLSYNNERLPRTLTTTKTVDTTAASIDITVTRTHTPALQPKTKATAATSEKEEGVDPSGLNETTTETTILEQRPSKQQLIPIPAPRRIPGVVPISKAVSDTTAVVIALGSIGSVAGGQLGVVNAMARLGSCTGDGEAGDDDSEVPIMVHPLRFSFFTFSSSTTADGKKKNTSTQGGGGGASGADADVAAHSEDSSNAHENDGAYAAASISNTIIIPIISAALSRLVVFHILRRVRGLAYDEAETTVGWPFVVAMPFITLAEGAGVSIFKSLQSKRALGIGLGCLGLMALILFVAAWVRAIFFLFPRNTVELRAATENPPSPLQRSPIAAAQGGANKNSKSRNGRPPRLMRGAVRGEEGEEDDIFDDVLRLEEDEGGVSDAEAEVFAEGWGDSRATSNTKSCLLLRWWKDRPHLSAIDRCLAPVQEWAPRDPDNDSARSTTPTAATTKKSKKTMPKTTPVTTAGANQKKGETATVMVLATDEQEHQQQEEIAAQNLIDLIEGGSSGEIGTEMFDIIVIDGASGGGGRDVQAHHEALDPITPHTQGQRDAHATSHQQQHSHQHRDHNEGDDDDDRYGSPLSLGSPSRNSQRAHAGTRTSSRLHYGTPSIEGGSPMPPLHSTSGSTAAFDNKNEDDGISKKDEVSVSSSLSISLSDLSSSSPPRRGAINRSPSSSPRRQPPFVESGHRRRRLSQLSEGRDSSDDLLPSIMSERPTHHPPSASGGVGGRGKEGRAVGRGHITNNKNSKGQAPTRTTLFSHSLCPSLLTRRSGATTEVTEDLLERYGNALGDKRLFYAEFISFLCSILVGVAEGVPATHCRPRAVVALIATLIQCVCSCLTLIPIELPLQIILSACTAIIAFIITAQVFLVGGAGQDLYVPTNAGGEGGPSSTIDELTATTFTTAFSSFSGATTGPTSNSTITHHPTYTSTPMTAPPPLQEEPLFSFLPNELPPFFADSVPLLTTICNLLGMIVLCVSVVKSAREVLTARTSRENKGDPNHCSSAFSLNTNKHKKSGRDHSSSFSPDVSMRARSRRSRCRGQPLVDITRSASDDDSFVPDIVFDEIVPTASSTTTTVQQSAALGAAEKWPFSIPSAGNDAVVAKRAGGGEEGEGRGDEREESPASAASSEARASPPYLFCTPSMTPPSSDHYLEEEEESDQHMYTSSANHPAHKLTRSKKNGDPMVNGGGVPDQRKSGERWERYNKHTTNYGGSNVEQEGDDEAWSASGSGLDGDPYLQYTNYASNLNDDGFGDADAAGFVDFLAPHSGSGRGGGVLPSAAAGAAPTGDRKKRSRRGATGKRRAWSL